MGDAPAHCCCSSTFLCCGRTRSRGAPSVWGVLYVPPPLLLAGFGVFPTRGLCSVCCRLSGQGASDGAAFPVSGLGDCVCVEGSPPSPVAGGAFTRTLTHSRLWTEILLPSPSVGPRVHPTCVTPALAPCRLPGRRALMAGQDGRAVCEAWLGLETPSQSAANTWGSSCTHCTRGWWWGLTLSPCPCVPGLLGQSGKGPGGRLRQTSDLLQARPPRPCPPPPSTEPDPHT